MKKHEKINALRRTLAVLLSTIVTFVVSLGSIPTMAFAAPNVDESVVFKFDIGDGASYEANPAGYTYDDSTHIYTASEPIVETSVGAEVALLAAPDNVPDGKRFIGWESSDGGWVAGSNVPLKALDSIDHDGEIYTFSAVYNDYAITYDFDEGKPTSTATFFQNPEVKDFLYDGLDAGDIDETDGYALIGASGVTPKAGYDEFVGWALEGGTNNIVKSLSSSDFTAGVAKLKAIYGTPTAIGSIAYCNAYEGLEAVTSLDQISTDALITVSGGATTYNVETGEITPVPTEDDTPHGKMLAGWDVYAIGTTTPNEKIGNNVTSFDTTGLTQDLIFVANWTTGVYNINYANVDGGIFDPAPTGAETSYTYNATVSQDIVLPDTVTTPDSGKAIVWTDKEGKLYDSGDTYVIPADNAGAISFRESEINAYTISYSTNGGTAPESPNPTAWKATDGEVTLNNPTYDAEHGFVGWFLSGETEFVDAEHPIKSKITALNKDLFDAIVGNSISLGANWSAVGHTITLTGLTGISENSINELEELGFTVSGDEATAEKTVDDTLTIPAIEKTGYHFMSWDDNDSGTNDGTTVTLGAGDIKSDMSFAAVFKQEFTVTFMDGDTELETLNLTYLKGDTEITLPALPDKDYYTKNGWILEGDSTTTVREPGTLALSAIGIEDEDGDKNLVFNAKYTPINRTITLNGLIGVSENSLSTLKTLGFTLTKDNEDHPTTITATITKTVEDSLTIPAMEKDGYRFITWSDGVSSEPVTEIVLGPDDTPITGNLEYTATFEKEYTLALSGLSGVSENSLSDLEDLGFTVESGTATMKFIGTDKAFILPNPIKDDYDFIGWYPTGGDESTAAKDVTITPDGAADDISYTAKFVRSYSVTFFDGATQLAGDDYNFTYLTGAEKIVLPELPDKTGYTKNGWIWAEDTSATPTVYANGDLKLETLGITTSENERALVFKASYSLINRTITLTGLTGVSENSLSALTTAGFTVENGTATATKTIEDSLTIPAMEKDGYRFIKWNDGDSSTTDGTTIVLGPDDTPIDDNLTYGAEFEKEYTLTISGLSGLSENSINAIEAAGYTFSGDGASASMIFIGTDPTIILPTSLEKADYDFIGWYPTGGDETAAVKIVTINPSSVTVNPSYTARFMRSYPVTFFDGTKELTSLKFTYLTGATKITLPAIPTKAGYTAGEGWHLKDDPNNLSPAYAAGEQSLSTFGVDSEHEHALVFIADPYSVNNNTITINGLTGVSENSLSALKAAGFTVDGDKATITKTVEESLTVPAIYKLHNVFDGWKLSSSPDEPVAPLVLNVGDITGDLTYEAVFSDAKYVTVNFALNGGAFVESDIEGWDAFGYEASVKDFIKAYADDDRSAIAIIPTPKKADNVFDGWTVDGGEDKLMAYTVPEPNDQSITLAANWLSAVPGETIIEKEGNGKNTVDDSSANTIEGILDDNVGAGESSVTKFFIEEDATGAGHTGDDIDQDMDDIFSGMTGGVTKSYVEIDITQYITSPSQNSVAHEINDLGRVVDIAYTPTNGTANLKAIVREHGNPPTRIRLRQLAAAPNQGEEEDGTYFIDGTVVHIYTQFFSTYGFGYATDVHEVQFDTNGGNETYKSVYTNTLGTLPSPTRSGYWSFVKWTYPNGSTATAGDTISEDTTLTAQWKDTTPPGPGPGPGPGPSPTTSYVVSFNANGGVAVSPITVTDGKLPTLPTTTKEGFTLKNWLYENGSVAQTGDPISSDVTLTAEWTEVVAGTYVVSFNVNGGSTVEPITVSNNVLPELPNSTREGFVLENWLYENGSVAHAGDPISGNITLNAKWVAIVSVTYTVYFNSKGGSAVSPITTSDNRIPTLPTSTREGYTLDSWLYANGTKAVAGDPITSDVTLNAKWNRNKEPAPTELVPTKNGVVVAKNNDGTRTVTLIDGSKYGKKPSINTIKGTDRKTYKITRIYDEAFKGNTTITKATIGSNVTIIGDSVFEGCTNLKTVTLGGKLTAIGYRAFADCPNVATIKIGKYVKTISDEAFYGCTGLKTLTIGAGVVNLGNDAFTGCTALSKLTVAMANIPEGLFKGYVSLTKLTIGSTTQYIGASAFEDCKNLTSASLGSKLVVIGDRAFASSGLKKAAISGRVTTVGAYAFYNCPNLASASTGKYVKTIGESAFQNCPKLKTASIGANVETIGSFAFADCSNLRTANIGKSVRTIGEYAYANCTSMKSTTIGKSVTNIGMYAYSGDAQLGTVKVNSKNLTSLDAVGLDCLHGIKSTATIKLPKSVFDQTKLAFETNSGAGNQVKYKKA